MKFHSPSRSWRTTLVLLCVGAVTAATVVVAHDTAPAPTTPSRTATGKPSAPLVAQPAGTRNQAGASPAANRTFAQLRPYPRAATTGVPDGTRLRPSGSLTVRRNGTVIDRRDVSGSIRVEADNVVIRRTRVRDPGGQAITVAPDTHGTVIEDVELDGTGNTDGSAAIGDSNYTLRRVHIHHFGEGPRANGNVVIENSYFHHFLDFIAQGAHQDAIQSTGGTNLVIRHNTLLMNVDGGNAAIMLGTDYGSRVLIKNNLVAGGGYTVYGGDSNGWTDVRITDNRFSRRFYRKSGFYGPLLYAAGARKSGNVWFESGAPL